MAGGTPPAARSVAAGSARTLLWWLQHVVRMCLWDTPSAWGCPASLCLGSACGVRGVWVLREWMPKSVTTLVIVRDMAVLNSASTARLLKTSPVPRTRALVECARDPWATCVCRAWGGAPASVTQWAGTGGRPRPAAHISTPHGAQGHARRWCWLPAARAVGSMARDLARPIRGLVSPAAGCPGPPRCPGAVRGPPVAPPCSYREGPPGQPPCSASRAQLQAVHGPGLLVPGPCQPEGHGGAAGCQGLFQHGGGDEGALSERASAAAHPPATWPRARGDRAASAAPASPAPPAYTCGDLQCQLEEGLSPELLADGHKCSSWACQQ